jgi:uncharacterized membrane protein
VPPSQSCPASPAGLRGPLGTESAVTVAWQATVTVIDGTVAGIPLGIGLGRFLWDLFARQIDVVPEPIVPVPTVAVVIAGALAIATLLALLPGRVAGRTPAAALLRSE